MNATVYKCPCCGAPLAFSGESGKLECASCGNAYETGAIDALNAAGESKITFDLPKARFDEADAREMRAYVCKSCGADLMTDATTTATQCPYCASPTVFPDKIETGVRPEKVVPFLIDEKRATDTFHKYFEGKRLLPNVFLHTRNRISDMRKLYVPYWLFDCDADADMTFNAEKTHTERRGDWEIRRTDHYMVRRAGGMGFDGIPVDGSLKMNNDISESLEPYDMERAVPFEPAVLAGAMADRADVNAQECQARAVERVESSMERALRDTVTGYDRVSVRNQSFHSQGGKATPVLMPVWLITTEKQVKGEKKIYTFAINGQTGALTCDVPFARGKAAAWLGGVAAGVFALGYALLVLLKGLGVIA